MDPQKKKKMTAPLIVTVLLIMYYAFYFGTLMSVVGGIMKFVLGVIPLIFSYLTIKVCRERIDEIKKGEEDDLSKY